MHERTRRQLAAYEWVVEVFGRRNATPVERARRLLEEANELAQSVGIPRSEAIDVAIHVYGKAPGVPSQEAGGVGVCLLAFAESIGVEADYEEARELDRVTRIDPDHFRERHDAKANAGVGEPTER